MPGTFIIGFDDTEAARRAGDFAAARARGEEAALHVVMVLEWSPYSFLSAQELEERHARRQDELARAAQVIEPFCEGLREKGLTVTSEVRYGHAGELLCEIARKMRASQMFIGRRGGSALGQRFLGSLAITLVQASPIPVTVVP
ncbi:universal stress protein [Pararhizobium haloflavum]|uniref:universal stress protein n=1 Tax=Pararhizobium haloflavum TaxID=2037914 RepID=UPI000C1769E2|nr:universal stress protein [Pararhizobium haloflavum]